MMLSDMNPLHIQERLVKLAKAHAVRTRNRIAEGQQARAEDWIAGYAAAIEDMRTIIRESDGPEHNVGCDVMSYVERMPPK